MSIGSQIRIARKLLNLTQTQLGERLGQPHSIVSAWENDARVPTPKNLKLLSAELKQPYSFFYETPSSQKLALSSAKPYSADIVGVVQNGEIKWVGTAPTEESIMQKYRSQEQLRLKDNSFSPEFYTGDILVWDYSVAPKADSFVIVHLPDNSYTIGRLCPQGERLMDFKSKQPLKGKIIAVIVSVVKVKNLY